MGCNRSLSQTADRFQLVVMSCNKDFACSFDVHAKAAKSDVKFTLHQINCLDGCRADGYASSTAVAWGHVSWPSNELRTLADYRVLHEP